MIKKYTILAIALFLASLNLNFILKPFDLVTGGTQGLAIIFHHIFSISPAMIILIVNVIMLIASYFFLSKETTYGTIVATFLYPFFVKITSIIPVFPFLKQSILCSSLIAGVVCGITGGLIYKVGFSSGGLTILNLLIFNHFHIALALINFLINFLIILVGCFLFGIKNAFYAVIIVLIGSFIMNMILRKNFIFK